jgi:hypothetical protein
MQQLPINVMQGTFDDKLAYSSTVGSLASYSSRQLQSQAHWLRKESE